jgi:hypothetical protein
MRWIAIALLTLHAPLAHALPWPGQGGGLYATIKHFKDFDSCIKQLTKRLPAEAALMMLGKRIELTCRAYQAAANDDASACKSLSDYRQRGECEQFYAIYAGRVKQCPMRGYPRHAEGFCAALARRDPALCRAAAVETQPLCKALLSGAAGCSKLSGLDKSRCVGATRLFRGLIKGIKPSLPKTFKPKLEMSASVISGAITLPSNAAKFSSNRVAHGILLADKAGSGDWLVINSSFAPHDAYRRSGRPPMNLELQVPISTLNTKIKLSGGANGSGKVNFTVRSPSYRYVQMSSVTGEAKITKLERKIGGRVMATFWLELTDGVDRIRVNGTLDTFVRDLVPLSRVANYMRYRTKPKTHRYSYNRGKLTLDELTWFKARIKKISDTSFIVDPAVRNKLVKDTARIRYAGSISRNRVGGYRSQIFNGYQFYRVYRTSALWHLGLRDRDIVMKANKKPLTSPEEAYAAYGKLRKARRIVLELDRGGKTVKITYKVRRVRVKKKKKKK